MSMVHSQPQAILFEPPVPQAAAPVKLASRLASLAALFVLELLLISIRFDTNALEGSGRFIQGIGDFGPYILQALIAFATVFVAFGYSKAKSALLPISRGLASVPFGWGFLAAHGI